MFKLFSSNSKKSSYGWFGNYSNWDDLTDSVGGYSEVSILEKTKDALLKVKSGNAVYERDSVVFDKVEHPFPLLTCILRSAAILQRPLHIIVVALVWRQLLQNKATTIIWMRFWSLSQ